MYPQSYNSGPLGWHITPGDGTYDKNIECLWISHNEMRVALKWVRNIPGTQGKRFLIHSINNDREIAVTLGISASRGWNLTKPPVHKHVLELQ